MSDGVSYDWTVDANLKGVDAGVKSLRDAEKGLADLWAKTIDSEKALKGLDFGHLAKEMGPLKEHAHGGAESFKGLGGAIEETHGHFKSFLATTGALLAYEGVKRVTEKVVELGKEVLHAAGGAERLDMSLKLTVGQEGAEGVLGWVDKINSKTRFTDDQLKGWTNQLLVAGVAAKDLDKFIAAGLDINARGGNIDTAIEALTRAQITGRIGTRQLVGLGIGINQLKELPEYQGLSEKALYKKVEEGSITKGQLFSLIAGKDNVLGDLALKAGQDFESKLKNLTTIKEQFFQKFAESPGFEIVKSKMDDIFEAIGPNSENGLRIYKELEDTVVTVAKEVAKIDFGSIADQLTGSILPAIKDLSGDIKSIVEGVTTFASGIGVAVRMLHGDSEAFDAVGRGAAAYAKEGASAIDDFLGLSRGLKNLEDGVLGLFGKGSVKSGLEAGTGFADVMSEEARDGISSMKEEWGIHSPSRVAEDIGEKIRAGFEIGVTGGDDVLPDAFRVPASDGPRAAAPWTAGSPRIELTIETIQVRAGADQEPRAVGQEIAESLRTLLPPALADALEQLNASGGNA